MIVLPDLYPVDPAALTDRHIVRVTQDGPLAANDMYGHVKATKRYPGGYWRVRWVTARAVGPGEPATGILHVWPGELVSCVTREQWSRMVPRLPAK